MREGVREDAAVYARSCSFCTRCIRDKTFINTTSSTASGCMKTKNLLRLLLLKVTYHCHWLCNSSLISANYLCGRIIKRYCVQASALYGIDKHAKAMVFKDHRPFDAPTGTDTKSIARAAG